MGRTASLTLHRAMLVAQKTVMQQQHNCDEAQKFEVVVVLEDDLPRRANFLKLWLTLLFPFGSRSRGLGILHAWMMLPHGMSNQRSRRCAGGLRKRG